MVLYRQILWLALCALCCLQKGSSEIFIYHSWPQFNYNVSNQHKIVSLTLSKSRLIFSIDPVPQSSHKSLNTIVNSSLFICEPKSSNTCSPYQWTNNVVEVKNRPRVGLTIAGSHNDDDNIIVCANNCYFTTVNNHLKKLNNLENNNIKDIQCQRNGFSAHILNQNQFLIGSPSGHADCKGRIEYYDSKNPRKVYFEDELGSSFGFAVKIMEIKSITRFLVSAPNAINKHGIVKLYKHQEFNLTADRTMAGEQMGAQFGYSLETNGTTIFIGAPWHEFQPTGQQGAVFVYKKNVSQKPIILRGDHSGGFGMALTVFNQNQFQAGLAVAAPFEDNGVVYIFLGTAHGISRNWTQKLKPPPSHWVSPVKWFGHIMSRSCVLNGSNTAETIAIASKHSVFTFKQYSLLNLIPTAELITKNELNVCANPRTTSLKNYLLQINDQIIPSNNNLNNKYCLKFKVKFGKKNKIQKYKFSLKQNMSTSYCKNCFVMYPYSTEITYVYPVATAKDANATMLLISTTKDEVTLQFSVFAMQNIKLAIQVNETSAVFHLFSGFCNYANEYSTNQLICSIDSYKIESQLNITIDVNKINAQNMLINYDLKDLNDKYLHKYHSVIPLTRKIKVETNSSPFIIFLNEKKLTFTHTFTIKDSAFNMAKLYIYLTTPSSKFANNTLGTRNRLPAQTKDIVKDNILQHMNEKYMIYHNCNVGNNCETYSLKGESSMISITYQLDFVEIASLVEYPKNIYIFASFLDIEFNNMNTSAQVYTIFKSNESIPLEYIYTIGVAVGCIILFFLICLLRSIGFMNRERPLKGDSFNLLEIEKCNKGQRNQDLLTLELKRDLLRRN